MKKKYLRIIMSMALALVLVFSLSAAAFADGLGFVIDLPSTYPCVYGQSYTLTVSASFGVAGADEGINYTWYTNGTAATTGGSYAFTASSNFSIQCVASGSLNGVPYTATSQVCNVTVTAAPTPTVAPTVAPTASPAGVVTPTITAQPSSANLAAGQTAALTVSAACPNLGNGVVLYYQWFKSASSNGANATQINGATGSSYTPPAATSGTTYYFVGIKAYNGSQYSSPVYSNVVYITYNGGSVINGGALKITKNPTGETVDAGGSATFVARADNAYSRVWRIVSKDTTKTVNAKDASSYFGNGLSVSGADTDTLVLSKIPASMNEWSVECKFIGADGKTFLCTTGAIIRVRGASTGTGSNTSSGTGTATTPKPTYNPSAAVTAAPTASPSASSIPNTGDTSSTLTAPTISSQPSSAVLSEGETTTLSVTASAPEGETIHYQWDRSDVSSNANGTKIPGAESPTYVPDTISGSKYYYVGVWSSDGTTDSRVVYSSPVSVTYTAPLASPSPSPDVKDEGGSGRGMSVLLPGIAMVLAAAAIGVGMFFLLKNAGGKKKSSQRGTYYDDAYDDQDDSRR